MGRYDCVVLFNEATIEEIEGSYEKAYPSTVLREEVGAIEEALREGGFNPYLLPIENFSKELVQTLSRLSPKFVFNLCEQLNGKPELEMCVAGLLELMGIPYTGSGPLALGLALGKHQVKQTLRAAGVWSARGYVLARGHKPDPRWNHYPVMVKPAHEDGSLGINSGSVCFDYAQLEKQASYIHNIYVQEALVEEYLDGREFNVSILGDRNPEVLAISEIDFSGMPKDEPRIVSYRGKWDEESPMYEVRSRSVRLSFLSAWRTGSRTSHCAVTSVWVAETTRESTCGRMRGGNCASWRSIRIRTFRRWQVSRAQRGWRATPTRMSSCGSVNSPSSEVPP